MHKYSHRHYIYIHTYIYVKLSLAKLSSYQLSSKRHLSVFLLSVMLTKN